MQENMGTESNNAEVIYEMYLRSREIWGQSQFRKI